MSSFGCMEWSLAGMMATITCTSAATFSAGNFYPSGCLVRRNFSFQPGEKGLLNRVYRRWVDRELAKRYLLTDFFFSLPPFDPPRRLERIFSLACRFVVEVETHPINPEEYRFLAGREVHRWVKECGIARAYAVSAGTGNPVRSGV